MKKTDTDFSDRFLATMIPATYPVGRQSFSRANSRFYESSYYPSGANTPTNWDKIKVPSSKLAEQDLLNKLYKCHGTNLVQAFDENQQHLAVPYGNPGITQLSVKSASIVREKLLRTSQGLSFRDVLMELLEDVNDCLSGFQNMAPVEQYISSQSSVMELFLILDKQWIRTISVHPYDPRGISLNLRLKRVMGWWGVQGESLHDIYANDEAIKAALSSKFTLY